MRIDLVLLSFGRPEAPAWDLGACIMAQPNPASVAKAIEALRESEPEGSILVWDATLPLPSRQVLERILALPGDVWHAGLSLGTGGMPGLLNFVAPTWMLNLDPSTQRVATSWRLSLRACLVRKEMFARFGGLSIGYETLVGAGLELGHRWIRGGAILRHVPELLSGVYALPKEPGPTLADEFRFVRDGYGQKWVEWAVIRAIRNGYGVKSVAKATWDCRSARPASARVHVRSTGGGEVSVESDSPPLVSVLIPTLERYPYLMTLLAQLERQSIRPFEVIVVDQTPAEYRLTNLAEAFPNLPLRVACLDSAGQCSSRNAGLRMVRGDYVLFLDDDDEVPEDLIEWHFRMLVAVGADASCGVADEDGAGPLPESFTFGRVSDVFPTNNSMLRREALVDSGLFDLAYDRGIRADHDLGLRLYLAGKLLYLNPQAKVLHRHAPRGGLREHGGRVISRAASRRTVTRRALMAPTEYYQWSRFFTTRQVRERAAMGLLASLRGEGRLAHQAARLAVGLAALPGSWLRVRRSRLEGEALLRRYPDIPSYDSSEAPAG